jgi:hypothetical protein
VGTRIEGNRSTSYANFTNRPVSVRQNPEGIPSLSPMVARVNGATLGWWF